MQVFKYNVLKKGSFLYLIPPFQYVPFPVLQPVIERQKLLDTHAMDVSSILLGISPGERLAFREETHLQLCSAQLS